MNIKHTVLDRFLRYVVIDTQSDATSTTFPSTMKQYDLLNLLKEELIEMGIKDVLMDDNGYIYANIPSNSSNVDVKSIFFCSHVDTAPDASGTDVRPRVHKDYQGNIISYPDNGELSLDPAQFAYLQSKIGDDIVTASGKTLLGSDDKAGVAIIMDMLYQFMQNPNVEHGNISVLFTPDEEIGTGVSKVQMNLIKADFGYTLDGGKMGDFENENFSADSFTIHIEGVSAHPGYAKGKMQHAAKIVGEILAALPKDRLCPESTDKKQGFIHPTKISGGLEKASVSFIIRDFVTSNLDIHIQELKDIVDEVLIQYPASVASYDHKQQYRNMKDILDANPHITDYALRAIANVGMKPHLSSIRGGTDGAQLSHKGLPCPNLFTGMQEIHSTKEWVSVQDMQKSVLTCIEILKIANEE